ncbi:MAG: glycine dehydrogenase, partial [Bacteroidaceae bacterium]|nr:glycine dehydrogenase [Bacteroidaceae bacterium]
MAFKYFPHTDEEVSQMLERIGAKSLADLYSDVPQELQQKAEYQIPEAMSEMEVRRFFDKLGMQNITLRSFLGAGYYDHYSPAVAQSIIRRSEFLTAYT